MRVRIAAASVAVVAAVAAAVVGGGGAAAARSAGAGAASGVAAIPAPRSHARHTAAPAAAECDHPRPGWIWCDDFERDRLGKYFEYQNPQGSFTRVAGAGLGGSYGMKAQFEVGTRTAGALHLAIGRTPQRYMRPADAGTADYRELYWRVYVRNDSGWTGGGGDKLSRAISFASLGSWAEAMIAPVWSGGKPDTWNYLVIDPASGTDPAGVLQTTKYNDFPHLRWLGHVQAKTPIFDPAHVGTWHCVEAHVRLNRPGRSGGTFELWIDGDLEARHAGLDWVGAFTSYGINAVYLENYWNAGSPAVQARYLDDFVVSTGRIGCRPTGAEP